MTVFIGVVGRTMEFTFDQTQISIIGSKYWDIVTSPKLGVTESAITAPASNSGSVSRTTTTTSSDNVSSWKRPASSQVRLFVSLSVCLSVNESAGNGAITAPPSNSGSVSRTTTTTSSDNVSSWKRPASSQVSLH